MYFVLDFYTLNVTLLIIYAHMIYRWGWVVEFFVSRKNKDPQRNIEDINEENPLVFATKTEGN